MIALYEMDFGMNTVIRRKQFKVDKSGHMLIPVPNAPEGPGGFIALLENYLIYHKNITDEDNSEVIRFPFCAGSAQRKIQFTSYATYRQKGTFFILISSETGDIFKVEFMMKIS